MLIEYDLFQTRHKSVLIQEKDSKLGKSKKAKPVYNNF